jgi:hypothetical protein
MKTYSIATTLFLLALVVGCKPSKTTVKEKVIVQNTNNTDTRDDSGTGGGGDGGGVSDGGQTIPYYKINDPPITVHGSGTGIVVWSSQTNLPAEFSQNIFLTNSRFNVRVIPRKTYYAQDTSGRSCLYQPLPYTKLKVGVRLRKQSSTYGSYHEFSADLDTPSNVYEFPVPQNTSDPLIVEILNVQWDYTCTYYQQQGHDPDDPLVSAYCPFDKVWDNDCVQIELQFSTDDTKDIPGTRD